MVPIIFRQYVWFKTLKKKKSIKIDNYSNGRTYNYRLLMYLQMWRHIANDYIHVCGSPG